MSCLSTSITRWRLLADALHLHSVAEILCVNERYDEKQRMAEIRLRLKRIVRNIEQNRGIGNINLRALALNLHHYRERETYTGSCIHRFLLDQYAPFQTVSQTALI